SANGSSASARNAAATARAAPLAGTWSAGYAEKATRPPARVMIDRATIPAAASTKAASWRGDGARPAGPRRGAPQPRPPPRRSAPGDAVPPDLQRSGHVQGAVQDAAACGAHQRHAGGWPAG